MKDAIFTLVFTLGIMLISAILAGAHFEVFGGNAVSLYCKYIVGLLLAVFAIICLTPVGMMIGEDRK